jgi:hypothetical protein
MPEMTVIRTARKVHRCDTNSYACRRTIEPGERYAYSSLPPDSEFGNEGWWHSRTCATCAVVYGRPFDVEVTGTLP